MSGRIARVLSVVLFAALLAAGDAAVPDGFAPASGSWPAEPDTGFTRGVQVTGMEDVQRAHYHLSVPDTYTPEQAWPLVLVLHGGPTGKELSLAMASVFAAGFRDLGAISVYPQALKKQLLEWNYPHSGLYLMRIVRQVAATYRIDPCRVYLVGHSMGGGGTWLNGAILRELWAGVAPLAGWYAPNPKPDPKLYRGLPIYCIHGDQDRAVPVQLSRMADKELRGLHHRHWHYVELAGVGHNLFKKEQRPEIARMAEWLLAQRRARPADMNAAANRLVTWGERFGWRPDGGPVGSYAEEDGDGDGSGSGD